MLTRLGRRCLMVWADSALWAGPTMLTGLGRQCLLRWADSAYLAGPTVLTWLGRRCLLGWADKDCPAAAEPYPTAVGHQPPPTGDMEVEEVSVAP